MTNEKRLEKLEKELQQTKRINRFCFLITLGVAVAATLGATTAPEKIDEIRAKKFILEDAGGKICGELALTEKGPTLKLIGPDGRSGAIFYAGNNNQGLHFTDANGKQRIGLSAEGNLTDFSFSDASGKKRVELNVREQLAHFAIFDAAGKQRIGLSTEGNNTSVICSAANGNPRVKAGLFDNVPNFTLCGNQGAPFWSATPDKYTE